MPTRNSNSTVAHFNNKVKQMSQVNVKVWREDKSIPLPSYGHYEDACCDLYVKDVEYDNVKDMYIVHTGLHVEIPKGYEMEIRPRSSNTKTEFYIPNSPCTVDAPYRGEIQIRFRCRTAKSVIDKINEIKACSAQYGGITSPSSIDIPEFPYIKGDRCAQLLVRQRERVSWVEVENESDLLPSDRGNGAWGSTGK